MAGAYVCHRTLGSLSTCSQCRTRTSLRGSELTVCASYCGSLAASQEHQSLGTRAREWEFCRSSGRLYSRVQSRESYSVITCVSAEIRGLSGHYPFEESGGRISRRLLGAFEEHNISSDQRRSSQRGPLSISQKCIYVQEYLEWRRYHSILSNPHASGHIPHSPSFTPPLLAPF